MDAFIKRLVVLVLLSSSTTRTCSFLCHAFQLPATRKTAAAALGFQLPVPYQRTSTIMASSTTTTTTTTELEKKDALVKTSTAISRAPPQIVQFKEPKTNTNVILIGTMHYNPTSIQMVKNTIQTLAEQNILGSVVVESCDIRWNTTMEVLQTPRGKILEPILASEMKAASDSALAYGRPCVLGDQRINATGTSLGTTFRETFVNIASPLDGGWKKLYDELKVAADVALPSGEGYLNAWSILDPRLLIAAPVSLAKYPLSFLARNPLSTIMVFGTIGFLTYLDARDGGGNAVVFADASLQEQISSIFLSLLVAALEIGLFGRVMVQVLLAERNEIIAKNILDQCKMYTSSNNGDKIDIKNGNSYDSDIFTKMFSFLSGNSNNEAVSLSTNDGENGDTKEASMTTMYVPGSVQDNSFINDGNDKVVVAVLGMAHINGIVKLLKEELVE